MPDTRRTLAVLQTLLPDNNSREISPQDLRDFLISTFIEVGTVSTNTSIAIGGFGLLTASFTTAFLSAPTVVASLRMDTTTAAYMACNVYTVTTGEVVFQVYGLNDVSISTLNINVNYMAW
jgi:hypothetical protein